MLCLVALNPALGFQAASVRSSRPALLASRASPSAMLLDAGTSTFLADAQILLDTAGSAVATGAAAAGDAAAAAPAADPSWFDRCARIGHGPAPPTSQPPPQRLEAHPPPWLEPGSLVVFPFEFLLTAIHDGLKGMGVQEAWGPSIIGFTIGAPSPLAPPRRAAGPLATAALRPLQRSSYISSCLPHICLTSPCISAAVKLLTFPLTKTQIESTTKMQAIALGLGLGLG